MHQVSMSKHVGLKIVIGFAFVCSVVMPIFWACNLSQRFSLSYHQAYLAYRPELIALLPSAIVLAGAWLHRSWATYGLFAVAAFLLLLKFTLGGVTSFGAWA